MALSSNSGVDIHSIVEAGQSFTVTDMTEIRDKTLSYMTMMMDRFVISLPLSLYYLFLPQIIGGDCAK